MQSVLDINVSCVPNYFTKDRTAPVNLLTWLRSKKYAQQIRQLRAIKDATERNKLKATLPAITPCGLFSAVNEKGLIEHSGFIQFDIDHKDNTHIDNYGKLKMQLSRIQNIAYCGESASGQGWWGLMRIAYADKHLQHWYYMQQAMRRYGIHIDPAPKNICSLRGYSYDPDAYYNHFATPLVNFEHTPPPVYAKPAVYTDNCNTIKRLVAQLTETGIDITEGYNNWFAIGCCIAANFGESGRGLYHDISQFHRSYDVTATNKKYDDCKKAAKDTKIGVIVNRCKEHRVLLGR